MMQTSQTANLRKRAPQRRSNSPDEAEREISTIVGNNIRTLRAIAGMSQTDLADELGITFQQVQKYEKGTNRVSAPKLVMMAEIFKTPISTFFSNTGLSEPPEGTLPAFGKSGLRAARIVEALPEQKQSAAVRMLQALSDGTAA